MIAAGASLRACAMDDSIERLARLGDGSAADLLDLPTIELIVSTGGLNAVAKSKRNAIIAAVVRSIEDENTSSISPSDRLQTLTSSLEREIAGRLRSHSALFWLTLFREILRINAVDSFSDPNDYTRQLRYTELSIVKYALNDANDVEFIDCLWRISPSESDMLALLEVCGMAGLASAARIDLRRLAMGGRLVIIDYDWRTVFDEPLHSLVETYSARRARYANIFHHAGVAGPARLPEGRGTNWIAMAGKTVGDITWSGVSKSYLIRPPVQSGDTITENDEYRPTFGLREHSFDDDVHWLELISAELEQREGFSVSTALAIIRAIASLGVEREQTFRQGHRLRSTALAVIDADEIVSRAASELGASVETQVSLRLAIAYFTRPTDSRDTIVPGSVFDLRHIVRLDSGELVIDFLTIFSSVWQLFNFLGSVDKRLAKQRATAFEHVISRQVHEAVPLAMPWLVNQKVRFTDGINKEIDAAFLIDETLLLCECKSMGRRPPDDIPSPGRLQRRWRSLQDALQQVDGLAELLSTKELRRPGPIPSRARSIVACVVTPSAEWIPSGEKSFWFTDDIPRFCTVGEVVRLAQMIGSGFPLPNRLSRPNRSRTD